MENNASIGLFLDIRREMKKHGAGVFGVKVYGPPVAVCNTFCDDTG